MRIAMVLPEPRLGGGVPGTGRLLALGLARLGHQVDAFTVLDRPERAALLDGPGSRAIAVDTGWRWNRWYSRSDRPMVAHLTQLASRAVAARTSADQLAAAHRAHPYDVVYRFSTTELLGLEHHRRDLPPIVVHPEVHAAGELAAMRRERTLARAAESPARRLTARAVLRVRIPRQRRALRLVDGVIAPSRLFARQLERDGGLTPGSVHVAPNPVELDRFVPSAAHRDPDGPWRLLFVGRISVRKGIDQLVELSHRLVDLAGRVHLDLVGGATLWSDYRPLLGALEHRVATYHGLSAHEDLPARMAAAHGLVQPSTYEPFAITVSEGLASGLPVIASDAVGAAEDVDRACCTIVPAGDVDGLERAVRAWVDALDAGGGPSMRARARQEAERLFSPERAARAVAAALESTVDRARAPYPVA